MLTDILVSDKQSDMTSLSMINLFAYLLLTCNVINMVLVLVLVYRLGKMAYLVTGFPLSLFRIFQIRSFVVILFVLVM